MFSQMAVNDGEESHGTRYNITLRQIKVTYRTHIQGNLLIEQSWFTHWKGAVFIPPQNANKLLTLVYPNSVVIGWISEPSKKQYHFVG